MSCLRKQTNENASAARGGDAFFSHRTLDNLMWFSRQFTVSSIFLCRSKP